MREWLMALIVVTAGLAGCLGGTEDDARDPTDPGSGTQTPTWHVQALGDGHDHSDRAAHANLTTSNFETIGHDPLVTEAEGTSPGGSSCADLDRDANDTRIGAQKAGDSRGIVLADVTDVGEPKMVGELWLTFTHIYDVAVVPGGDEVALITSQVKQGPAPEPTIDLDPGEPIGHYRDACTGETTPLTISATQDPAPRPMSLLLVDISDPSQPTISDQRPITALGHSVYATDVAGEPWVMGVTEGLSQGTRHYHLYRVTDAPTGPVLEPISVYAAQPKAEHAATLEGHSDAWIKEHPETGQLLGYLSAGTKMEIVDYSTPEAPQHVASWTDIADLDTASTHNIHSVHAMDGLVDGRHFTVVGPELSTPPDGLPTGVVWVLDTTDPADPQPVAAWTLPAEVTWEGALQFSPHYMDVVDGTLFVSMYHGGVWAVDLAKMTDGSPDDIALLDSVGVYLPALEAAAPDPAYSYSWTPTLEEVFALEDGTLVTFDANSGVYTFRFDASQPMPAPEPWDLDPEALLAGTS